MTLANGEQIIKDWNYATQKGSSGSVRKTLTVTNKRIVHEVHSHVARIHHEIPLNSVKSISMTSVRKISIGAIFSIILGILVAIASILFSGNLEENAAGTIILVGGIILGIVLVVLGILALGHGAFTLEIATKGTEGTPLYVGSSGIVPKSRKQKKVKIKVDLKVVDDIMDTLGAILLDNIKE